MLAQGRQVTAKCDGGFVERLTDWLGFNVTFSTNRLCRAFEKYVAVKKK